MLVKQNKCHKPYLLQANFIESSNDHYDDKMGVTSPLSQDSRPFLGNGESQCLYGVNSIIQ